MRRTPFILTALLLIAPSAHARRRAVAPPSAAVLSAVIGTEATATNYGSTPSLVRRCTDDQPCVTEILQPGETKHYDITGLLRIGPTDAGSVDIESDGLTLPRASFLSGTKLIPGVYDLAVRQRIGIVSDYAGAVGLKSVSPAGTTQEVHTVPISKGVTYLDPATVFSNLDNRNFQFELTDNVAAFAEWTNTNTGKVTRLPAFRTEDAMVVAYLARVTPTTTLLVKNAMLLQQGAINIFFQPTAGLDFPKFVRGAPLQPYGMISITDVPAFAGSNGEGSLRLEGAPETPTSGPADPFYAWAITDGTPYPVTSFQLAASAHANCAPNLATYHDLRWTGLRTDSTHHTELDLQNTMSQPPATGTLSWTRTALSSAPKQ